MAIDLGAIRKRNEGRKEDGAFSDGYGLPLSKWSQSIFDDFDALLAEVERLAEFEKIVRGLEWIAVTPGSDGLYSIPDQYMIDIAKTVIVMKNRP